MSIGSKDEIVKGTCVANAKNTATDLPEATCTKNGVYRNFISSCQCMDQYKEQNGECVLGESRRIHVLFLSCRKYEIQGSLSAISLVTILSVQVVKKHPCNFIAVQEKAVYLLDALWYGVFCNVQACRARMRVF